MSISPAVEIVHLAHWYGEREAIHDLSLSVTERQIFAILGPNGSGKTTLFRVLSTLIPLQQGEVRIFDHDLRSDGFAVRSQLGVVFQAPSIDKKLTVIRKAFWRTAAAS
jgi:ABC-2 type transport system ATP-binding protein